MSEQPIKPEKITKPIQLLAAWLAGLFAIDTSFLIAASRLPDGSWQSGALVVAAIINVPLFLGAVFLLQTRFRPELQEDSYYSTYLSRKTNEIINIPKEDVHVAQLRQRIFELEDKVLLLPGGSPVSSVGGELAGLKIGINKHLIDKESLEARLHEQGVLGYSLFGSDEPPKDRVVAISEYLPKDRQNAVMRAASELGFYRFTLFNNLAEDTEEDVLLGSYGEATYQIATNAA